MAKIAVTHTTRINDVERTVTIAADSDFISSGDVAKYATDLLKIAEQREHDPVGVNFDNMSLKNAEGAS